MKTSSAKAKGRRLQQQVAKCLLDTIGQYYGLEADDIKSTGMGQSGVDVLLSPAAQKLLLKLKTECKNVEKLNVVGVFQKHYEAYKQQGLPILVHSRNRTEPMVTMDFADFLHLLLNTVQNQQRQGNAEKH